jgi:hypothetical protein
LNKHLTCDGLLILNFAGAHEWNPLLSRFDFLLPEVRMTSALFLDEMLLHNRSRGSV